MSARPDGDDGNDVATVDVSLIDAMLMLTPEQRLLQNDRMLKTIQDLRDGFAARRAHHSTDQAGGERR